MHTNSTPYARISPQWLSELRWLWSNVPRQVACELVSSVQMNVICLILLQLDSPFICEHALLPIWRAMLWIHRSFSLSLRFIKLVGQTWRLLFGLFARNINYDGLIGWSYSSKLQPGILYTKNVLAVGLIHYFMTTCSRFDRDWTQRLTGGYGSHPG